jgi:hypothetical protein
VVDDRPQLVEVQRFRDVFERAGADGIDRGLAGAVRRHDHHVHVRVAAAHRLERLQPVHTGHAHVHEDERWPPLFHEAQGVFGVAGERALVAFVTQKTLEGGGDGLVVVDDEDVSHDSNRVARYGRRCPAAGGARAGCRRRALPRRP